MMIRVFLALLFLILPACSGVQIKGISSYPTDQSRLLLYVHSIESITEDLHFDLSSISLQDEAGNWLVVSDKPVEIGSRELVSKQKLIRELFVKPGYYSRIRLVVSNAYIKRNNSDLILALPAPNGEVLIDSPLRLQIGDSTVLSIIWNPQNSVRNEDGFIPDLKVEPELSSPRDLLLFVSNSGSNYLSIIDRSLERVVGAVTVGMKPSGMAFDATRDWLYVVNSGSRSVSVVDTTQYRVDDSIPLTTGIEPTDVVFVPDFYSLVEGSLYIVNKRSNDVTVLNTQSRRVLKTIPVGNRPSAIAVDINSRQVYVANELSDTLSIINTVENRVVSTISVERRPTGIVIGADNVYVLNKDSMSISVISKTSGTVVDTIALIDPPARGLYTMADTLFITSMLSGKLTSLNASQHLATWYMDVGDGPFNMAWDMERNRLYVVNNSGNTVSIIDPHGEKLLKKQEVGNAPYGVLLLER